MKKNMYDTIKSALDLLGHYDNDYAQGEGNIRDACKELESILQQKKEVEVSDNRAADGFIISEAGKKHKGTKGIFLAGCAHVRSQLSAETTQSIL